MDRSGEVKPPSEAAATKPTGGSKIEWGGLLRKIRGAYKEDPNATDKITLRQQELERHKEISKELGIPPEKPSK